MNTGKSTVRVFHHPSGKLLLIKSYDHTPDGNKQYWESIHEELDEEEARDLAETLTHSIELKWGRRGKAPPGKSD